MNCVEFTAAMNFRVYYSLLCELRVVTNRTFFVIVVSSRNIRLRFCDVNFQSYTSFLNTNVAWADCDRVRAPDLNERRIGPCILSDSAQYHNISTLPAISHFFIIQVLEISNFDFRTWSSLKYFNLL